ncbi:glucose 1-dehydrogenase [Bacillus sp. JJ1773]|uniref:SDR family NAD(P)-dependent oxidoreductase n=1 Tax=Bacillus sp. JJ1773 TaxID=3122965 RepID=UPI002FFFE0B9
MGKLDGKVAIVTGGSRGQGASHVQTLVKEGAKVVIADILADEGEALAKELGENARFIKLDVSNESNWQNVVNETESTFGPINILVNNAGINFFKPTQEMNEEEYRRVININQVSVFLGMKTVFPSMSKTKEGSIINISSVGGLFSQKGAIAYSASKFAVTGMTKAAALDFAEHGIRVNSIHPGTIRTPMLDVPGTEDAVKDLIENTPLKRLGESEEVSKLVSFLASNDSSFSTGSEFTLDGGATASL